LLADIIVDLQYGDCGKGKITHHLCKTGEYTHVIRYNGGCNAGHTIYHEGEKFVTHHIPAGVFFGIKSIIGSGCVLNIEQFFTELEELRSAGIDVDNLVYVAKNTHVITPEHLEEDGKDEKIGTTKRGNGPAYRDKYFRTGRRAEEFEELKPYMVDLYDELHNSGPVKVLCEGAQGFGLDIDWGDYPYVTSSHCTTGGALLNGIPHHWIRDVWGVAKIYETYVGSKKFEPDDQDIFKMLRWFGQEFGATTGRPRQCNWMDLNLLEKAAKLNGVNKIVINKMDILQKIDTWKAYRDEQLRTFSDEQEMKNWIEEELEGELGDSLKLYFSQSKDKI